MVEVGEIGQVWSIHRMKDEVETNARNSAKAHKPGRVLVYKGPRLQEGHKKDTRRTVPRKRSVRMDNNLRFPTLCGRSKG
jgi:hypothetical protein